MKFETLSKALDWLYQQKKRKKRENLERIQRCIELLKIHTSYFKIHIAGTNGKGSTANYLKRMLIHQGKKVGFFISPYVLSFQERIQINDQWIEEDKLLQYCNQLYDFSHLYEQQYDDTIPFFELTFLMALLYFEENQIDVAVIECGLGGRLDATNVLSTDVQVITNIGFDHRQQLGFTLEEIAWHKLGITEANKPCFTCVSEELLPYFKDYAKVHNIDLHWIKKDVLKIHSGNTLSFVYQDCSYETSLLASYQAYNASLAIAVMKWIDPSYPKNWIDQALMEATWAGRFEEILPQVVLDGAHNPPAIEALISSLQAHYKGFKFKFVFSALQDKEVKRMIFLLDSICEKYYFTTFIDKRASSLMDFEQFTTKPYELFEDYQYAIKEAFLEKKENDIIVITGSLHFISAVRMLLQEEYKK